jgi:PGF-pre-PGF domain-containing protein
MAKNNFLVLLISSFFLMVVLTWSVLAPGGEASFFDAFSSINNTFYSNSTSNFSISIMNSQLLMNKTQFVGGGEAVLYTASTNVSNSSPFTVSVQVNLSDTSGSAQGNYVLMSGIALYNRSDGFGSSSYGCAVAYVAGMGTALLNFNDSFAIFPANAPISTTVGTLVYNYDSATQVFNCSFSDGTSIFTGTSFSATTDALALFAQVSATDSGGSNASLTVYFDDLNSTTAGGASPPPTVNIVSPANNTWTNYGNSSIGSGVLNFTFNHTGMGTANCTAYDTIDQPLGSVTSLATGITGTISFDGIPEGANHNWYVTCTNASSYSKNSSTYTLNNDYTAPNINFTYPINGRSVASLPQITGTVNDTGSGVNSTFGVYLQILNSTGAAMNWSNGQWAISPDGDDFWHQATWNSTTTVWNVTIPSQSPFTAGQTYNLSFNAQDQVTYGAEHGGEVANQAEAKITFTYASVLENFFDTFTGMDINTSFYTPIEYGLDVSQNDKIIMNGTGPDNAAMLATNNIINLSRNLTISAKVSKFDNTTYGIMGGGGDPTSLQIVIGDFTQSLTFARCRIITNNTGYFLQAVNYPGGVFVFSSAAVSYIENQTLTLNYYTNNTLICNYAGVTISGSNESLSNGSYYLILQGLATSQTNLQWDDLNLTYSPGVVETPADTGVVNLISPANNSWTNYGNLSAGSRAYLNMTFNHTGMGTANCTGYNDGNPLGSTTNLATNTLGRIQIVMNLSESTNVGWYVTCTNTSEYSKNSSQYYVNIDYTAPTVNLVAPPDNAVVPMASISSTINFTDAFSSTANCTLYVGGTAKATNASTLNNTNTPLSGSSLAEGNNSWYVNCTDLANNVGSSATRNVVVDTINPAVSGASVNVSRAKSSTIVRINVTVVDANLAWVKANGVNMSTGGSNLYNLSANATTLGCSEGTCTITFVANDSARNVNNTITTSYVVDDTAPIMSVNSTYPASGVTYSSSNQYYFNITWSDGGTISTALLELGGTNYTMISTGSGVYYYVFNGSGVPAASYTYRFIAIDDVGNVGNTSQYTYVVAQATPVITALLNGAATNLSVVYQNTVNASGSTTAGTLIIYKDGTMVTNNVASLLAVGYYRYDFNVTGNQNYTNTSITLFANVTKGTPSLHLYLNGEEGNTTVNYGTKVTANGTNSETQLTYNLYREGVSISNGDSVSNLAYGSNYTYIYNTSGNANYSAASVSYVLTVNLSGVQNYTNDTSIVVPGNVTEIVVGNVSLSDVNTTADDVDLSFGLFLNTSAGVVQLGENNLTLNRVNGSVEYTIEIPANTNLTGGPTWDGKFTLPTLETASNYTAPSGNTNLVISAGSSVEINLTAPAKITLPGMSGKSAAWSRGAILTQISLACNNADAPTNIDATINRMCYADSGSDLVIWTYHFTSFAAYTPAIAPSSSSSSSSSGGGGSVEGVTSIVPGQFIQETWTILNSGEVVKMDVPNGAIGVTKVEFNAKSKIFGVWIKVSRLESLPSSIAKFSDKVYRYLEITKGYNLKDELIANGKIYFKVQKTWFAQARVSSENVALFRYSNGKWSELKTMQERDDESYVYYSAETPGFSYFVIGEKKAVPVIATVPNTPVTTTAPTLPNLTKEAPTVVRTSLSVRWFVGVIILLIILGWIISEIRRRKRQNLTLQRKR